MDIQIENMENMYSEDERQYLQMMQENITRMASNSANAKTWMVTIVAAFLAIGCQIEELGYWLLLALIPIFVFWYIDAYYLRLERQIRNREQRFINFKRGAEVGALTREDLVFDFRPLPKNEKDDEAKKDLENKNLRYVETGCQMCNKSVYPLYLAMIVIVAAITLLININL